MKMPKLYTLEQIDQKLTDLIKNLKLENYIKPDDVKSVIYHEEDLNGTSKLISGFSKYAKTETQFDQLVETMQLAWNYLSHKTLGNLSPFQKTEEYYYKKPLKTSQTPYFDSSKKAVYELFEHDLPQEIRLVKHRKNEWSFEFSIEYYRKHDEFHTLLKQQLQAGELMRGIEKILQQEAHVMEAASYLAYMYEKHENIKKAEQLLELSVKIIKNLFPPEFDNQLHYLPWQILENRELLMLLLHRAIFIERNKGALASIPYYEEILNLNPNDNQGIRTILSTLYLKTKREEKVLKLRKQYPDDLTQEVVLGYALALIKLGEWKKAGDHLMAHFPDCKHSIKELLKTTHTTPKGYDPHRISVGGKDEAYLYWENQGNLWQATKGALEFLKNIYSAMTRGYWAKKDT